VILDLDQRHFTSDEHALLFTIKQHLLVWGEEIGHHKGEGGRGGPRPRSNWKSSLLSSLGVEPAASSCQEALPFSKVRNALSQGKGTNYTSRAARDCSTTDFQPGMPLPTRFQLLKTPHIHNDARWCVLGTGRGGRAERECS
jgi:hypothetical protein